MVKHPMASRAALSCIRLGFTLYDRLRDRSGNLLLSPYSISVALAMVREGAARGTLEQLDRVLDLGSDSAEAYAALAAELSRLEYRRGLKMCGLEEPAFELTVANRLWAGVDVSCSGSFTNTLETRFDAALELVDFADPVAARRRIEEWIGESTQHRIRDILPPGQPTAETTLLLANAIYFKAPWAKVFQKSATEDALFHLTDSAVRTVQTMHQLHWFEYLDDEDVQVLELPYMGGKLSMMVILPREHEGLAAVEASLSVERLGVWLAAKRSREIDLSLPRFRFESEFVLNPVLASLGMSDAFDPERADFSRMTPAGALSLSLLAHKAVVSVDEEGTEAAAASMGIMETAALNPPPPIEFRADHPFLFLVRHGVTGCVLFLGRVADPTESC